MPCLFYLPQFSGCGNAIEDAESSPVGVRGVKRDDHVTPGDVGARRILLEKSEQKVWNGIMTACSKLIGTLLHLDLHLEESSRSVQSFLIPLIPLSSPFSPFRCPIGKLRQHWLSEDSTPPSTRWLPTDGCLLYPDTRIIVQQFPSTLHILSSLLHAKPDVSGQVRKLQRSPRCRASQTTPHCSFRAQLNLTMLCYSL